MLVGILVAGCGLFAGDNCVCALACGGRRSTRSGTAAHGHIAGWRGAVSALRQPPCAPCIAARIDASDALASDELG